MKKINNFYDYREFLLGAFNFVSVDLDDFDIKEEITKQLQILDDFEERNMDFNQFLKYYLFSFVEHYKNEDSCDGHKHGKWNSVSTCDLQIRLGTFKMNLIEKMIENTEICNILNNMNYSIIRAFLWQGIKSEEDFRLFNLILKNTNEKTLNAKVNSDSDYSIIEDIKNDYYRGRIAPEYKEIVFKSINDKVNNDKYSSENVQNKKVENWNEKIEQGIDILDYEFIWNKKLGSNTKEKSIDNNYGKNINEIQKTKPLTSGSKSNSPKI